MIIDKKTITNVSNFFDPLMMSFEGTNYVINTGAKTFFYTGTPDNFNLSHIRELFPDVESQEIDGHIQECSFAKIKEEICDRLSYFAFPGAGGYKIKDAPFLKPRNRAFWLIVSQVVIVDILPNHSFLLVPRGCSYFTHCVVWDLCFILLWNHQGLLFFADAFD